ncbi:Protein of unknown function [Saccharopolyspora kobensis]|uniref:DUF1360 domain-containing protein n=1 Tax=Saccharopolyspora kobensis TaxID=146035 RepID=A0A1H6AF58_9PSEU|nr:DUF1360 domain-containing protein [Saccharopolyspora kobensis]SEG47383.1 Protein of unknown function [Saccharopolyspora kobensis]SFE56250.1 Protein of unknown function [Saccharopolyspora kobensis]
MSADRPSRVRADEEQADRYRGSAQRPLSGYLVVMGAFVAVVSGAAGVARGAGRRLPSSLPVFDVVLLTVGTHKVSRTLTKDAVTSPLRSPFARYAGQSGPSEVAEEVRKPSQLRHAIGELVTCPFCLDLWIATGFMIGMVFAPRLTRTVATTFSVLAGADFLQLCYDRLQSGS